MAATIQSVLLPVITPFVGGEVDDASYENLLHHYLAKGITGLLPLATTGESPTIKEDECHRVVELTLEVAKGRGPRLCRDRQQQYEQSYPSNREPNPAPIKYVLAKKGLITSPELRLPMSPISEGLRNALDTLLADGKL